MMQTWHQETSIQHLKRKLTQHGQQLRLGESFLVWSNALVRGPSASMWQTTTQRLLVQKYDLVGASRHLCRANQSTVSQAMSENQSPNKLALQNHKDSPVSHQQRKWMQFLARKTEKDMQGNLDESSFLEGMGSTIGAGPLYLSALDQGSAIPRRAMSGAAGDTALLPLFEERAQTEEGQVGR